MHSALDPILNDSTISCLTEDTCYYETCPLNCNRFCLDYLPSDPADGPQLIAQEDRIERRTAIEQEKIASSCKGTTRSNHRQATTSKKARTVKCSNPLCRRLLPPQSVNGHKCKIGRCPLRFCSGASCLQMLLDHERMAQASSQLPIMAEEYHDEDQDEA